LLATLLMSRGMPLIQQGDEMGRTQRGNNNAYAQDNEITWVDWEAADGDLVDFVAAAHRFRKEHPALTHDHFLDGRDRSGLRDVAWLHQQGREMNHDDWNNSGQSVLGMHLRTATDEVLVWFNRHAEGVQAILPPGPWAIGLISDDKTPAAFTGNTLLLPPRSVVALLRAQMPKDEPVEIPQSPEPSEAPAEDPVRVPPETPSEAPPAPVEAPPPTYPDEQPPPPRSG
jgi:glycogen operon protein